MTGVAGPPWPIEIVPDEHDLFLRALGKFFADGRATVAHFNTHGAGPTRKGTSTNWSQQYKTAAETRPGLSRPASDYGVLALQAGAVRKVASFCAVEHTRRDHNRAHTDVWGLDKFHLNGDEAMKLADARLELAEIARIVIDP